MFLENEKRLGAGARHGWRRGGVNAAGSEPDGFEIPAYRRGKGEAVWLGVRDPE